MRRGAYGAIMDEEDEGAKFCEEDIDQILQRRTKTITIESEGRGSTFAKVKNKKSDKQNLLSTNDLTSALSPFVHMRVWRLHITGFLKCSTCANS